ncbi:hypothetical protein C3L33_18744, partial [Rhododendron williamsianum]
MASAAKSIIQTLRRYIKKPWEITGPCADPECKPALPKATELSTARVFCPATAPAKRCTTSSTSPVTAAAALPSAAPC